MASGNKDSGHVHCVEPLSDSRPASPAKTVVIAANCAWNVVNFRSSLVRALIEENYSVTVVAPPDDYAGKLIDLGCRYVPITIDNRGTNPLRDLKLIRAYYRVLADLRPSCLLAYTIKPNIYGSLSARLLGIPVINTVEGLGSPFVRKSWVTLMARQLFRLAFAGTHRGIFVNAEDRDYFIQTGLIRGSVAVRVPGCGVDTARFAPGVCDRDGAFRFLLAGRLLWDKGIREFVEAARRIRQRYPHARFQLLGFVEQSERGAVSREDLQSWQSEGLIEYLGSAEDVVPFIAAADCVVLPSYYREGIPRALMEAASMGKPIIGTDSVGCRDIVEDGVNGFTVRARDAADLAEKMEQLMLLPEHHRDLMGRNGRDKVLREFDERLVIREYLRAIEAL